MYNENINYFEVNIMKKIISILCTAALLFSAVMPASAAQAVLEVTKDAGDNQENVGTIKFDPGDWNSEKISFFIWDESEDDVKAATKDGWVDIDKFPEDNYELVGGKKLPDGTFESFEFEIPDGHVVFMQFFDPDRDKWTYDCVLTKDALGDTASLTGKSVKWRESDDYSFDEVKFKDSGLTTRLYYNWNGDLIGEQIHPNLDRVTEVAILIYGFSNHIDEATGKTVVTPERVTAAINAFNVSREDVMAKYRTFEGYDDRYNEEFAESVLFPDETPDDAAYTYYFMAPDNWFKKDNGADNEDIGFFAWKAGENSSHNAKYPGIKMTPAPEIGENVFKIENVDPDYEFCIFNAYKDYDSSDYLAATYATQIQLEGYEKEECPYDPELTADNFNGWIFVLDLDPEYVTAIIPPFKGEWFTIDDYKNHEDYYGTYFKEKDNPDFPTGYVGDLNGDLIFDSSDALEILRMSVGLSETTPEKAVLADVDGDGEVLSGDALLVLRYSIGAGENFGKLGTPIYR